MNTTRPNWNQAAKQVMSTHLLHSWRMFFRTGHLAHHLDAGTPGDVRGMYGTTMAMFLRRLVAFYFPPNKPRPTDVHAGRYVPNWHDLIKGISRAPFDDAHHYAGKYVAHLTESLVDCPAHLPIPQGGKIIAALAPVHNMWLRAVVGANPADLDVAWARNMICLEIEANPSPKKVDGPSEFQTDHMVFRFFTIRGEPVSTPPEFLLDMVNPTNP